MLNYTEALLGQHLESGLVTGPRDVLTKEQTLTSLEDQADFSIRTGADLSPKQTVHRESPYARISKDPTQSYTFSGWCMYMHDLSLRHLCLSSPLSIDRAISHIIYINI